MKHPAPKRLVEDPHAAPLLRAELQRAVAQPPIAYDTEAGLETLRRTLDLGPPVAADPAPEGGVDVPLPGAPDVTGAATGGGAAAGGLAIKLLASLAGITALSAAGFWALAPGPTPPPSQTQAAPSSSAPGIPDPQAAAPPPAQAPDALAREASELARVRELLAIGAAAQALQLAEQGHARFVGGALYPEREALSILSLCELGQQGAAQRRADAFLRRFPDHPMRERVRAALAALRRP